MNILLITRTYYPHLGGVTTAIKEVAERLVKRGHECSVLTIKQVNSDKTEEMVNGVHVTRINSLMSEYLYGFSPAMYSYFKKNKSLMDYTNLVHIHGYHTLFGLEAVYLCRNKNKPIVFTPHYHAIGHTEFNNLLHKLYKPIGCKIFNIVDKIICVSNYESKLIKRNFNIKRDIIRVIPHGVKKIDPYKKITKSESNRITLLYVGHLMEYKGVKFILEGLKELEKEYGISAVLNIVGTGDYKSELTKFAKKLQVDGRIVWQSNLSDLELHKKFKEADIFLLLSRAEAYGIVVAEALAAGTPCIVTDTSAISEFLNEPGCIGVTYPPEPKELAKMITKIFGCNIKIGPFSNKIRTWDEVAKEYEKVYGEIACNNG